jgi:hypothetical protein
MFRRLQFRPRLLVASKSVSARLQGTSTSSSSSDIQKAAEAAERVIVAGLKVTAMRRMHQSKHSTPELVKRLELQAWRELQLLPDADVEFAEGRSVAQLLIAWAYFSRFWEKGKDGPANPLPLSPAKLPDDIEVTYVRFGNETQAEDIRTDSLEQDGKPASSTPANASRFSRKIATERQKEIHVAPRPDPLGESLDLD